MIKRLLLTLTATLACLAVQAQISVPAGGSAVQTFDTQPAATEWSQGSVAGGNGDITTAAALDTGVNTDVSAGALGAQLLSSPGSPPTLNAAGQWASAGLYIMSRPTGDRYTVIMATLRNDTPNPATSVKIEYDLKVEAPVTEQILGHRVYVSTTGAAGSWVNVPGFNDDRTTGHKLASVSLSATPWAANGLLYVIWVDDNGSGSPDDALEIDNAKFTIPPTGVPPSITTQPVTTTVLEGQVATLSVGADGSPPLTYQWFKGATAIPGATGATLLVTNTAGSGRTVSVPNDSGNYHVVVTGSANPPATSATVTVTVTADTTKPIAEWANMTAVAGEVVVNLSKSLSDNTANVTNLSSWAVELQGVGNLNITNITHTPGSPRIHIFADVALDPNNKYFVMNTLALPDDAFTPNVLPANTRLAVLGTSNQIADLSHVWKYSDNDAVLPANWFTSGYDDTGADWKSGPGPFDAKSAACRATTLYGLGAVGTCINMVQPGTTTDLTTAYFRTHFDSPLSGGSNALLHLQGKVDDGVVVYLNGVEIGRVRMAAGAFTRTTLATATVGDGDGQDALDFYVPNLVAGDNLLAIELHQASATSSDLTMGLDIGLVTGGVKSGPRLTVVRDPNQPGIFDITWTGADRLQASPDVNDANGWFDIPELDYRGLGPNGSNSYQVIIEPSQPRFFYRTIQ
jgi:hypothetical protein